MTKPYTYLIGWTKLNKWYYGVRYAKNCHPSDLFVKYFTSSSRVKNLLEIYGIPDIIQIRKTFNTAEEAILWEQKVLNRINIQEKHWLNTRTGNGQYINKGGYKLTEKQRIARKGKIPWNKGVKMDPVVVEKAASKKRGKAPWNKGKKMPSHFGPQHSIAMKGTNNPMFGKSAHFGKKWYTNGQESIFTYPDNKPENYYPGRHSRKSYSKSMLSSDL